MALKHQIQQDMLNAMKAHEDVKVSALRMLKAAILKYEVSGERKEATDQDVLTIIGKEIKSRRDSIEQFKAGNRMEMAEKEEKEIAVLMEYMPPQMSEEELKQVAKEIIATMGAKSKADLGKVMGAMMGKVKGMADGDLVSKVVKELLP
jgi:uncharacterized protein